MTTTTLPPGVGVHLGAYAAAIRRTSIRRAAGWAIVFFAIWIIFCSAVDRFAHLWQPVRLGLLAGGLLVFAYLVIRGFLRARTRADWIHVASEIEQSDKGFNQRLVTVVSRLLDQPTYRGSEEILSRLSREIEIELADPKRRRQVPGRRRARAPWIILLLVLGGVVAVWRSFPDWQVSRLAERAMLPWADIPPVTTTQLEVFPGNCDVQESQTLHITADAKRLHGDALVLCLNSAGEWTRVAMNSVAPGHFEYALAAVERDLSYYVIGGDATSRIFTARVLRRPSVDHFEIVYRFPGYARRPAQRSTSSDGRLEGPAGSDALLTVFSSDPLQSALLTINSDKVLMGGTDDPKVWKATIPINHDGLYGIDLISTRQVVGGRPPLIPIHAIPQRPPVVRLMQSGFDLRLTPHDTAVLSYDAGDDYGLGALSLRWQVNAGALAKRAIRFPAESRSAGGSTVFDLGLLEVRVGDIVSVWMQGTNSAGIEAVSDPMHILLSTEAFDLEARDRAQDMDAAAVLGEQLVKSLEQAQAALSEAENQGDKRSPAFASASSRANLALTHASESAMSLRQALSRAILRARQPQLCTAVLSWIDAAQLEAARADELFRSRGRSADSGNPAAVLQQMLDSARALNEKITVTARGERSRVTLAAQADLQAWQKQVQNAGNNAAGLKQALRRSTEDVAMAAKGLGLDAAASDFLAQLNAKIGAEQSLIGAEPAVDYASIAQQWEDGQRAAERSDAGLTGRLSAAAEAEAVRSDSDLIWARDLQLLSRTAGRLQAVLAEKKSSDFSEFDKFVEAVRELQAAHQARGDKSPDAARQWASKAAAARVELAGLGGGGGPDDDGSSSTSAIAPRATAAARAAGLTSRRDSEDLALQASAATASHDYQKASQLDEALARRLEQASPASVGDTRSTADRSTWATDQLRQTMSDVQQIDGIGQQQQQVAARLQQIGAGPITDVVGSERSVVNAIATVVSRQNQSTQANARERAADAFLETQVDLAALPQVLSEILNFTAAYHTAMDRAMSAKQAESRIPDTAPGDQKGIAHRATLQATADAQDAQDRVERALRQISPAVMQNYLSRLSQFVPESMQATGLIADQLVPATGEVGRAARAGDTMEVDRHSAEVRSAIESIQKALVGAQDAIADRDPLVAAKSFAGAAVSSLTRSPPDLPSALQQQGRATGALARAWDRSVHDAAAKRLALVPALQPVYGPAAPAPMMAAGNVGANLGSAAIWGRLGLRDDQALQLSSHESDPVGYEEPLKLYFDALGKAQAGQAKVGHP